MMPIDLASGPVGPFTLSVHESQLTPPIIERIKETLRAHPGKREVQLVVSENGKTTTHKLGFQITSSPSLHADLKAILGPDCVRN
jgi:DNA polymerase-3 subunit alpha